MEKNSNNLFEEFNRTSTQELEEKIIADLKGADYDKKLLWPTGEGFFAQPYYRKEHLSELNYLDAFPGDFPFVRGQKKRSNDWYIRQDIIVNDIEKANQKALGILMKGINSLGFILDERKAYSKADLDLLLKNIFAEIVEINFVCGAHAFTVLENHYEMLQQYNRDFEKIYGSIDFDPLGRLSMEGKFYQSLDEDFELGKKMIGIAAFLPNFSVLSVHGQHFHNAGSSLIEELAFSLAQGAEYLTRLTEMGLSVNQVAPKIKFNFAVGSNYLMEIAKIRAARMLWANIVKAYGPCDVEVMQMKVHAVTSKWNMTIYDPHVNMLRTTTESMSAIIGGIDSLTVRPYNFAFEEPAEFSERIARNQQLLLKEESYFDKVVDPAAGSYYIEMLTDSIANEAWKLFLEVDSKGGYLQALHEGFIQQKVKITAQKRYSDVASRKTLLLGTNQFPKYDEYIEKSLDESVLSAKDKVTKNAIIETLKPFRGAMAFEQLRYSTDQYSLENKRPGVFMFTYGNLAMRIARSQFSGNFFACAGYEVIDNPGFKTVNEGIQASLASKAEIVVICSSDDAYPEIAPEIYQALKDQAIVVIAGYPKNSVDMLKAVGIEHFIHVRSNVLEMLERFQEILGIESSHLTKNTN